MAHELLIEDGKAAMFYVDEPPWHDLGTRLESPPNSRKAIEAAGLAWTVAKVPLYIAASTRLHELPDRFALVREDKVGQPDCPVFGIVGREYVPLQNREAFEFFDPLVVDGDATYETAGALGRGERVWIQARLSGDLEIAGDVVERFLLLSNSHDGASSVQIKLTPIRVVCKNTLTAALAKGRTIQVRHNKNMEERLDNAKELLGVVQSQYEEVAELFRRMTQVRLDRDRATKYFAEVFPDGATPDANRRAHRNRQWALYFYVHGRGNEAPEVRQTLWAAYNGVTELVDHRKPKTLGPDTTSRRLASVWFGAGATIKQRALQVAQDLAQRS